MNLSAISDIIDFLLPRYCSICGRRLHRQEKGICTGCLLELNISEFADGHKGNLLERSLWLKMPIERAAAFLVYDRDNSQRQIVLDLKYHNRPKLGQHMAPLIVQGLNNTHFFDFVRVFHRLLLLKWFDQPQWLAQFASLPQIATKISIISTFSPLCLRHTPGASVALCRPDGLHTGSFLSFCASASSASPFMRWERT